jgi:tripartite motif-containing protein 2/3
LCKECIQYEPHSTTSIQKHDFGLINDIGVIQMKKFQLQLDNYKLQLQTILTNDTNNNFIDHQNHNHQYSGQNERNVEQISAYLNNKYQKSMTDIDNMYQFYKQLLDERKQELKAELDSIYNTKQILINNLQLMNKSDENLNNLKIKIDNIITFTQKLMQKTSSNTSNLNELLLVKKPIEQKLQLLLQQLALTTNDMNLNKINKDLFNIEFVTNYSIIQPSMLNTFGYLKSNMNIDLASVAPNFSASSYKPKPIGPPTTIAHRHNSPKLNEFPFVDNVKATTTATTTNNLQFNDLLTFETWSNGINTSTTTATNGVQNTNDNSVNDLATLQAEQLLDLTTSSTASTTGITTTATARQPIVTTTIANTVHHITTNSHHHLHPNSSILPARSQLKRQKMIYNCKFGEFGINDGQFTEPSGVAINQLNDIIVADTNSHRIQIFDRDGHFKFKFGECGKREGQLLYPNRVSIVKQTGDIIVTERSPTHQIQIYNQFGHFIRKFGANILQHPRGVCVDAKGHIIVVECKVMRVIIFDQYGNVVHKFSCSKYLEFPNGVCVNDKQEIFISDNRAHCIKVFNYDGQFLRQIGGEGITNYPIGVGINTNGEVLVADNHNNFNLTVFTQDGQLINALESKVKHAQCFDVGLMDDGSIVLASKDYRIYVYRYISTQTQGQTSPLVSMVTSSAATPPATLLTSSTNLNAF